MNQSTEGQTTVYLVDASIYIFQAHFSPHVECEDMLGNDVSAFFGFTQFLLQFLRRFNPSYVGVALDQSLFSGFRHQLSAHYKSNRELPDENLARQLEACYQLCPLLGMPAYASRVYEADDIIGTMARNLREQKTPPQAIAILSKDKDLAQLLLRDVDYLWDYSGNRRRYKNEIFNDYGVYPEQIADYLGLIGDSVDCITGVPGVGPVKAQELLRRFTSIEGVYGNLGLVADLKLRGASKLAALLQAHSQDAVLSKMLATIVDDVKDEGELFCQVNQAGLKRHKPQLNLLRELFHQQGLKPAHSDRLMAMATHLPGVELD
ncbi:MAG: flap endonuclease [SAR86 cluster bacterium]|uniref:Flap endonuclease n=1 Tax=SAR86 cluster bacterium TaxID=2030880 RepID=A0A2A4MIJ7_9GAMM|nr:MAG: flap endonuclease [SAR86 cluster bacterium]